VTAPRLARVGSWAVGEPRCLRLRGRVCNRVVTVSCRGAPGQAAGCYKFASSSSERHMLVGNLGQKLINYSDGATGASPSPGHHEYFMILIGGIARIIASSGRNSRRLTSHWLPQVHCNSLLCRMRHHPPPNAVIVLENPSAHLAQYPAWSQKRRHRRPH
jgi:hypothetical protein